MMNRTELAPASDWAVEAPRVVARVSQGRRMAPARCLRDKP
jgi:hypothetical protein